MRRKKYYQWKCQKCGLTYSKVTSGEPRRGCPCCGDTGAKRYRGTMTYLKDGSYTYTET